MLGNRGTRILHAMRDNTWLTQARVARWSWVFLMGYIAFFFGLIATSHGLIDLAQRPLGADFSSFYSAGHLIRLGSSPYDQAILHNVERWLFGPSTPFYVFAYPPVFLLLMAPLSALSYPLALSLWQIGSLAIYALAMDRLRLSFGPYIPRQIFLLASLAYTAVFVSLTSGQNGLLTAAFFAFGLAFLDSRPLLGGMCFGLLIFKPQLGLLIPFALATDGRWRAFVGASITIIILGMISLRLFGFDVWRDFVAAGVFSRQAILDNGQVGYGKLISVFAGLRIMGVPLSVAYYCQAIVALVTLMGTVIIWRSSIDVRLKGATLCIAALFVTPYALDYDMMILAPAIALVVAVGVERRFETFEGSLLTLIWIIPMFARAAIVIHLPLALFVCFLFLASVLVRARTDAPLRVAESVSKAHPGISATSATAVKIDSRII